MSNLDKFIPISIKHTLFTTTFVFDGYEVFCPCYLGQSFIERELIAINKYIKYLKINNCQEILVCMFLKIKKDKFDISEEDFLSLFDSEYKDIKKILERYKLIC